MKDGVECINLSKEKDSMKRYSLFGGGEVARQIIVLLGSTALKNILGKEYSITASRGRWIEKKGIYYMPTWHPAALLRDENKKIEFWCDLKLVIERYSKLKK